MEDNHKFSTSVNIERDFGRNLNYILTANALKSVARIIDSFVAGIHSFCLIGSYGTGKSSFLLEFENCLKGSANKLFKNNGQFNGFYDFEFINIVGSYNSLEVSLQSTDNQHFMGGVKLAF